MNIERLDKIINAYIGNFEMINDGEHFENMKWSAIYHYKENFDINASDFYEMFKFAIQQKGTHIRIANFYQNLLKLLILHSL